MATKPKRFKRFETPELILHWVNGIPFVTLLLTGGLMIGSRFFNMDRDLFLFLRVMHKTFGAIWLLGMPATIFFIKHKIHFKNIKDIFTFTQYDLDWMLTSVRSLFNKNVKVPESPKFNTGQKINCILVVCYYFGFAITGLSMWFYGTILISWYMHASIFFASLPSVGGHLYLSFINPSTRVGLFGIFHGWVPYHYVEHHHSLQLLDDPNLHLYDAPVHDEAAKEDVTTAKAEILFLIIALVMGGVGLKIFGMGRAASLSKNFDNVIRQQELSGKHQSAELQDCTVCHALTGEIDDDKCLKCHPNIAYRMQNRIGHHGTFEGLCMNCHLEHPELGKSIIPFDKENFDHNLAVFKRDGKHAKIECDKCHKRVRTSGLGIYYLGLKYEFCTDCHEDRHNRQFKTQCTTCHTTAGWQGKDLKFNHDENSKFKLVGKHSKIECQKCHKPTKPEDPLGAAQFVGLKHECIDCHQMHDKQFGEDPCQKCHKPDGWKEKDLRFVHNNDSKFSLTGKHTRVECIKCHKPKNEKDPLGSAKFRGIPATCPDCHKDQHNQQFTPKICDDCHTPNAWQDKELKFVHDNDSKFRLEGKHIRVECIKCHKVQQEKDPLGTAKFRGIAAKCQDCHKDPHNQQFVPKNCDDCHTSNGWQGKELRFLHDNDSKFKLEGKHGKVDCVKCHIPRTGKDPLGSATFKGLKTECESCHKEPHRQEYGAACQSCHSAEAWPVKQPPFNHNRNSQYPLEGKHQTVKCLFCHDAQKLTRLGMEQVKGRATNCILCHQGPHQKTLGDECSKCHSPTGWKGRNLLFRHNKHSEYKIDRNHLRVPCAKCHVNGRFKPLDKACEKCHPSYNTKGKP